MLCEVLGEKCLDVCSKCLIGSAILCFSYLLIPEALKTADTRMQQHLNVSAHYRK